MKDKFKRVLQFWKNPETPSRAPEIWGPYIIHTLTYLLLKGVFPSSYQNPEISFAIYICILILSTFIMQVVAKVKMVRLTVAQTFSILSYSQIYFIPFGIISRFVSPKFAKLFIISPAMAIQPYFNFLTPDSLFYD